MNVLVKKSMVLNGILIKPNKYCHEIGDNNGKSK